MSEEKNTQLGSIGSVLWGFDMLLRVLKNTRKQYTISAININDNGTNKSHLAICIDHAWNLFRKYYKLTDESRAYVVAMALDPRQKYKYFYRHWPKKYWAEMRAKVEGMYEEFRINDDDAATSPSSAKSQSQSVKRRKINDFNIRDFRFEHENVRESELKRYLKASCLKLGSDEENDTFDILEW